MNMTVHVLHNVTTHDQANAHGTAGQCGYSPAHADSPAIFLRIAEPHTCPGDILHEVGTLQVDAASVTDAADLTFEAGNAPMATELVETYRSWYVRSLSVGDVVVIDTPDGPHALSCESAGWTPVEVNAERDRVTA